jgi:dTMP kinase
MQGVFITFEGNDGSGKSTVIERIAEELKKNGREVILTREPGGIKISEQIRQIILDKNNSEMDSRTEALLYAASRRQHVFEKIRPALEKGNIVLCDRFIDSSLAYQGYARGIGIDEVYNLNLFATGGLLPDLTIYIEINPEVGFSRMKQNSRELDRLELESISFHKAVHEGYRLIADRFKDRIVTINGEKTPQEVIEEAKEVVLDFMNRK